MRLFIPPKYDIEGRKQIWFLKTGDETLDDFLNGALTVVSFTLLLVLSLVFVYEYV